jgi:hypothetical protein
MLISLYIYIYILDLRELVFAQRGNLLCDVFARRRLVGHSALLLQHSWTVSSNKNPLKLSLEVYVTLDHERLEVSHAVIMFSLKFPMSRQGKARQGQDYLQGKGRSAIQGKLGKAREGWPCKDGSVKQCKDGKAREGRQGKDCKERDGGQGKGSKAKEGRQGKGRATRQGEGGQAR